MSAAVYNAQVSLFRGGTAISAYGSVIDAEISPYMQHVPACLTETSQTVSDPATQTPMIVRSSQLLLPNWVPALASDQVQDEATGDFYAVEDIVAPPTIIGAPVDLRLLLRRISAQTAT